MIPSGMDVERISCFCFDVICFDFECQLLGNWQGRTFQSVVLSDSCILRNYLFLSVLMKVSVEREERSGGGVCIRSKEIGFLITLS